MDVRAGLRGAWSSVVAGDSELPPNGHLPGLVTRSTSFLFYIVYNGFTQFLTLKLAKLEQN